MRYICLILSIFLFIGATSACGISDVCCSDATEQVQAKSCCSDEEPNTSDSQSQGDMPCCHSCVYSAPSLLSAIAQKVPFEALLTRVQVELPVHQHSFDFHEAIWQPPKRA